jgi:hypothetical protein
MNFRSLSIKLNLKSQSNNEIINIEDIKKIIKKGVEKMSSSDYLSTIFKKEEECIFIIEFNLNNLSKRPNGVYELFSDIKSTYGLKYEIKPVIQQEIKFILLKCLKENFELVECPKLIKT